MESFGSTFVQKQRRNGKTFQAEGQENGQKLSKPRLRRGLESFADYINKEVLINTKLDQPRPPLADQQTSRSRP